MKGTDSMFKLIGRIEDSIIIAQQIRNLYERRLNTQYAEG
jgi:hypothetical protein